MYDERLSQKVIVSGDGSKTLLMPEMNETYHSTHGALTESRYVFIEKGLKMIRKPSINVFEVGFGTGLNALLSLEHAFLHEVKVNYKTIEAYPLDYENLKVLSYGDYVDPKLALYWAKIHDEGWEKWQSVHPFFQLYKTHQWFQDYDAPSEEVDIIYYDAFAPSRQAEMWEVALCEKCIEMLRKDGMLVTYCAQGQFRRNLQACGMEVEQLSGPPGKREMIRAFKM